MHPLTRPDPALLPAEEELVAAAHVVRIPLAVRFRGLDHREALLLDGPAGWGEFAPFTEYEDGEAARWLASAIEAGWGHPAGGTADGAQAPPSAPPVRDRVPVNATVPAVGADRVPEVLARFPGCTTAKVKVAERGQGPDDDVARVAAVREVLGPGGRIRVDANAAWDVPDAVTALRALARHGLEYAEQPVPGIDGLRDLRLALARAGVDVRIAADESIRKAGDPLRVALAGAADVAVVKVAPLGGVTAALDIAGTLSAEHGIPVVVSSALDTSVGLAAGVALAAALPDLPYACGLGTASLLAADVTGTPLRPAGGSLPVRPVTADADLLATWAAPPDRLAWWLDRLRRCRAVLAGSGVGSGS